MNVVVFILLKLFPILMVSIGLHGCMVIFGLSSIVGALYVFYIMKETKGMSLDTDENANSRISNAQEKWTVHFNERKFISLLF